MPEFSDQFKSRLSTDEGAMAFRGLYEAFEEMAAEFEPINEHQQLTVDHARLMLLLIKRQFPEIAEKT